MRFFLCVFLIILGGLGSAQAKVFSFGGQTFSAYFNITGAQPPLGHDAVAEETALPMTYSQDVGHVLSGEFGVSYSSTRGHLRLGIEVLKPQDADGMAHDGTSNLYRYDLQSFAFTPKLTVDITLHGDQTSRSYVAVSVGRSFLQVKNYYTMTQDGINQFPGLGNHHVQMNSEATQVGASLGYETHFTDRTTIFLEFGYRQLKFDNLKYKNAGTSFNGSYTDGEQARLQSGEARIQDYTGAFASLGFRFYL